MQVLGKQRALLRRLAAIRSVRWCVGYLALALVATCSAWAAPQIGGTIAFVQATGGAYEVHVVEAGSDDARRVWHEERVILNPSLSPDAQRVAFETGGDLFIVSVDGSGHTQVTQFGQNGCAMGSSWSPDGRRLAYGSQAGLKDTTLSVVNRDGEDARVLVRMPPGRLSDAAWSPRGGEIVYTTLTLGLGNGLPTVLVGVDTGDTTLLMNPGGYNLAWSPDGTQLAFIRGTEVARRSEIYAVPARPNEEPRRITQTDMWSGRSLSWIDPDHIAYLSTDDARMIHITDLEGNAEATVEVGATGDIRSFDWVDPARAVRPTGKLATTLGRLKAGDGAP